MAVEFGVVNERVAGGRKLPSLVGSIERTFHYDENTGVFRLVGVEDVEPYIKETKALYADVDERAPMGNKGTSLGARVASIPPSVWADLVRRGIAYDDKALRKWVNDPENRFFRTRPGRV